MASFGGWAQFGGSSQFGGFQFGGFSSRAELYYFMLKQIAPPGAWSTEDDTLVNQTLRAEASVLADHYLMLLDRMKEEMFPMTADETLEDWERVLQIVPPLNASVIERQNAATARYRGGVTTNPKDLKGVLWPLLQGQYAFQWNFKQSMNGDFFDVVEDGNGSITPGANYITIATINAADCRWEEEVNNASRLALKLPHLNEDVAIKMFIPSTGTIDVGGEAYGLVLYKDQDNATFLEIADVGDGPIIRLSRIVDGVFNGDINAAAVGVPSAGIWLELGYEEGEYVGRYKGSAALTDDDAAMTEITSFASTFVPRYAGMFARNTTASNGVAQLRAEDFRIRYLTQELNVEFYEPLRKNIVSAELTHKFFAFVRRNPTDSGNYDLKNAQRQMDKLKHGHTLILVGESNQFMTDDEFSLTDRDIIGI